MKDELKINMPVEIELNEEIGIEFELNEVTKSFLPDLRCWDLQGVSQPVSFFWIYPAIAHQPTCVVTHSPRDLRAFVGTLFHIRDTKFSLPLPFTDTRLSIWSPLLSLPLLSNFFRLFPLSPTMTYPNSSVISMLSVHNEISVEDTKRYLRSKPAITFSREVPVYTRGDYWAMDSHYLRHFDYQ